MKQTIVIVLIVITLSLTMTGCVAPDGTWKFDGTVKHEDDEVVPSPTPEVVYVTQTPEQTVPGANFGAIIITSGRPGTEAELWKECDGCSHTVYDRVIFDETGEGKLIAPVPGTYTLTTDMFEYIISVEESDIICRHTINA